MPKTKIRALKGEILHGRRVHAVGDVIEMSEDRAARLVERGDAEYIGLQKHLHNGVLAVQAKLGEPGPGRTSKARA